MANKIKVGVRVRPFIEGEMGELKVNVTGNKIKMLSQTGPIYEFDHVFGPDEDTQGVFERLAESIVTSVTKGFNGTIFAYGQTASGKTHTMMGDEKNELLSDQNLGIIPLSVIHLFSIMKKSNRQFIVRVSYMELYNESITDLQDSTNGNLQIRGDVHGGVYVDGLTETTCSNSEDVLAVLLAGKDNRTIRETKMNVRSSRSHTILTIILESRLSSEEDQDIVNLSYLHLVDLAGSEKISVSNSAISIKEGRFINLSLLTLGTVISKLSTKGDITHIPYRDSKLTRILQPALGGNANTAIICTVSPIVYEETESTLKFAQRAKHIANKPIVNEVYLSESAKDKKIAYLQEENSSLKKQLRCYTHDKENSPNALNATLQSDDRELFVNSPLFNRSRRKTFVVKKDKNDNNQEESLRSFIPSCVTTRRNKCPSNSFFNTSFASQMMIPSDFVDKCDVSIQTGSEMVDFGVQSCASCTIETAIQTDSNGGDNQNEANPTSSLSSCFYTDMDKSYLCEHRKMCKTVQEEVETLQFKYDEAVILAKEKELEDKVSNDQLERLQRENQMLKECIEDLTAKLNERDGTLEALNEKYINLEEAAIEMESQFQQSYKIKVDELFKAQEDKNILEEKLDNILIQHENELKVKDSENNKLRKEIANLDDNLRELSERFDSSVKEINTIIEENKALKLHIDELTSMSSSITTTVVPTPEQQTLKSVDDQLQPQLMDAIRTTNNLLTKFIANEDKEKDLEMREKVIEEREQQFDQLKQQLEYVKDLEMREKVIEEREQQFDQLEQQLEYVKVNLMEKEEMEITTMKKLNIHKERVDVLENEMETLNTENIQIKSDKEGIELELRSFQEKVNQLEGEIASLNMKIVELESSSKGVIEEMTKSKELSSVRESSQSGEEISEESTLKEVNITLKEQVSSLIKENEELQQTISELDEFNEELSKDVSKFCKEVDRLLIVNETLELQLKEANQRQVPAVENNEERKEMLQIIEFKDKQLEEKERAINSKDKEMQEKEKKFNLIRQELEDMEEKVLLEKEEMEMSFIKTVEELKCYKCKVKEFNKRESELTEKLLSMEVQVSSLQAEIKQKEAVINESKNKLEELTVELEEKTQLLENTRKELRDSTNSQQEDELSKPVSLIGVGGGPSLTMQESYDRLEFDHDKLNKQHQRLKDELIKTRNERDRYKKERNTFRVKYYELSGKEPVIEPKTTSSTGSNSSTSTIPPTISDTVPTASIKEESLASVPTPKVLRRSILSFPLPNSMKDVPKENIEEVSQVKTITSSALCDKGKPKLIVSKWDQSMLEMAGEAKKTNNDDHRGSSMLPPPGKLTEKQKNDCKQQ